MLTPQYRLEDESCDEHCPCWQPSIGRLQLLNNDVMSRLGELAVQLVFSSDHGPLAKGKLSWRLQDSGHLVGGVDGQLISLE